MARVRPVRVGRIGHGNSVCRTVFDKHLIFAHALCFYSSSAFAVMAQCMCVELETCF